MLNQNTKWVLFLATGTEPEVRHIYDLAFGLFCLQNAGYDPADFEVYIDGTNRGFISQLIQNATGAAFNIKSSNDFFTDLAHYNQQNIVMFVTGHGSIDGIDANPPITPFKLLNALKGTPGLINAVVYLGQCQAGIFNFLPAGRPQGTNEPDVIFMGATNLHNSLSNPTTESFFGNQQIPWVANLFLLYLFKWLSSPVDVDGDSKLTVIDSYKFAGVMANNLNKQMKGNCFISAIAFHDQLDQATKARDIIASTPGHDPNLLLTANVVMASIEGKYKQELELQHTHQECWILNANPAQRLEF